MDSKIELKNKICEVLVDMLNKDNSIRNKSEKIFVEAIKSETENILTVLIQIILCKMILN